MRKAEIKVNDTIAGWLTQDENGYNFIYDKKYLETENPEPVSLTLPLQEDSFVCPVCSEISSLKTFVCCRRTFS